MCVCGLDPGVPGGDLDQLGGDCGVHDRPPPLLEQVTHPHLLPGRLGSLAAGQCGVSLRHGSHH